MSKKTLYVSDLDGTLMRSDIRLSEFTVDTVNGLVGKGMAFTYATARSIQSAREITGGLKLNLPVITRNGAVLADNTTGGIISKALFTDDEVKLLKELIPELPECGFVSCFFGNTMHKMYCGVKHTDEFQGYVDYYRNDPAMKLSPDFEGLFSGEPGYVTLIGHKDYIAPIYERVKQYQGWETLFQKDTYREEYWLEVCPQNCTKAKSVLKLKEELGYDRLVVFGDALNDRSMFEIADESYAVSNAVDELKKMAAGVIGSNDEDAVANKLKELFLSEENK